MNFELEVQKTIFTALSGNISAAVYDSPPQNAAYPYAVIGDDFSVGFDTCTSVGREIIHRIHIWDNYHGFARVKTIAGQIDSLLNRADLTVNGFHFIDCQYDSSDFFNDADGKTRHGVIAFRFLIEEN